MHADRPQAVSLFFSKVSVREKERGRRRGRRGKRKRGGREEVLGGGALHLLQDYFFFNSFKMEIIKSHNKKEKNFDQEREKKFSETLYCSFFKVLIWHMAQSACMHLEYINKY